MDWIIGSKVTVILLNVLWLPFGVVEMGRVSAQPAKPACYSGNRYYWHYWKQGPTQHRPLATRNCSDIIASPQDCANFLLSFGILLNLNKFFAGPMLWFVYSLWIPSHTCPMQAQKERPVCSWNIFGIPLWSPLKYHLNKVENLPYNPRDHPSYL